MNTKMNVNADYNLSCEATSAAFVRKPSKGVVVE
jgi:hypothetical protein